MEELLSGPTFVKMAQAADLSEAHHPPIARAVEPGEESVNRCPGSRLKNFSYKLTTN